MVYFLHEIISCCAVVGLGLQSMFKDQLRNDVIFSILSNRIF